MISGLPREVESAVKEKLTGVHSQNIELRNFAFSPGGCINQGGKLATSSGAYFVKWNSVEKFPGMFEAEARGLRILRDSKSLSIPTVVARGEAGAYQFLILEYIEQRRPTANYWATLGEQVAALHKNDSGTFGLDHDNYIGSLPQHNHQHPSWIDFFRAERIEPQIRIWEEAGNISNDLVKQFEGLFKRLPDIIPTENPSLIHGDLWSGNVIVNHEGNPCLIDPAVYYGHREIEIAFTTLFGGFDNAFYEAYYSIGPLMPGFKDRFDIYNLYPLLVHANLFGGHYMAQVRHILAKFA